ncbi:hypothetical protein HPMBJEAJ_00117 [Aeromonas phage avDM6]|nr:hypothetical protein HPMBJEAJ_00117 [Aeromonas phage avDM6]
MIEIVKCFIVIILGIVCICIAEWSGKKDASGGLTGISVLVLFTFIWIYVISLLN